MATPGPSRRLPRSPSFPSFDRKALWLERTRNLPPNDIERAIIDGEINAMSDEEVTAALASVETKEEEVEDPLPNVPPTGHRPITVEDVDSNEGDDPDPTNRYRESLTLTLTL